MGDSTDKPRLRPLNAVPVQHDGQELICLYDTSGLSDKQILVNPQTFFILSRFDGEHTVADIQLAYTRQFGELLLGDRIGQIVEQLDEAMLLESDRLREYLAAQLKAYRRAGVREATLAGDSYPDDPADLRELVRSFFTTDDAPGPPQAPHEAALLKAVVTPHIDYTRGARGYAHAYKALAEGVPADTYVIIGIAHQPSSTPYAATRNAFRTPLGRVEVDVELLDRIEAAYPGDLYADEVLHIGEHSVELQVVMLQAVLEGCPFKIVPLLASSFDEVLDDESAPARLAEVEGMAAALKQALTLEGKRVCLIAAADLAHVGNQFGDPGALTSSTRAAVDAADRTSLAALEGGDAEAFIESIGRDKEFRKVCGVPALYTMLLALDGAATGRLLHYEQAVTPEIESMVSFAAMAFR